MDEEENGVDSVASIHGSDANENNNVTTTGPNGEVIEETVAQPATTTIPPAATAATPAATTDTTTANPAGTTPPAAGSGIGIPIEMNDFLYQSGVQDIPAEMYADKQLKVGLETLGLGLIGGQVVNDNKSGESSVLINSDRVIINSKAAHTIIAGAEGVALTSPNKVNIDADESVTIFGTNGVFLGVPNKGTLPPPYPPKEIADAGQDGRFMRGDKKLKSYPSPDAPYEPLVLGLKLVNWLDDLLVVLKNLQILTNTGLATPREDGQWDFKSLQARLPELVSNYIFLDGYSHDKMNYDDIKAAPTADQVTKPKTSINVNVNLIAQGPPSTALVPSAPTGPNAAKPGYGESAGQITNLNTSQ
jgi:hypothetical protein